MEEIQFESEPSFYRICLVTVPGLFQIQNQEQCTNGETCNVADLVFIGTLASDLSLVRDIMPEGINVSIVPRDVMGSRESDGSFS